MMRGVPRERVVEGAEWTGGGAGERGGSASVEVGASGVSEKRWLKDAPLRWFGSERGRGRGTRREVPRLFRSGDWVELFVSCRESSRAREGLSCPAHLSVLGVLSLQPLRTPLSLRDFSLCLGARRRDQPVPLPVLDFLPWTLRERGRRKDSPLLTRGRTGEEGGSEAAPGRRGRRQRRRPRRTH